METGGQQGLQDIVSFFNMQSTSGDVSTALSASGWAFKIALFVIMTVGALAMAVWISRIAVDIICLVTRGTAVADKMGSFGTGKGDSYDSVGKYLKGNLLEIILVIVLITFLITGWLFRLIAMALSGVGVLLNKLLGLDIGGGLAQLDADAFKEQISARRTTSLRNQYDDELASVRHYANVLYDKAKDGAISDDPAFNQAKSMYTQSMVKADLLATELNKRKASDEMKLGADYFKQHTRKNGDGACNSAFMVNDIQSKYGKTVQCAG
ncbi:hypothetical protein [Bacillus thuringiensis]|uniref:hypothetical protein n=1 Tax=Bacillus thuringiensis TaxID=1428 RepID=UPI000BFC0299|nr:hypothetical protein [Bacillus thuringiensis]PGT90059.1 hypothetical protein COD17_09930 [Bacillus thuringiensis]